MKVYLCIILSRLFSDVYFYFLEVFAFKYPID